MSYLLRPRPGRVYQFAETEGHALVLLAFFVVGVGPGAEILSRGVPIEAVVMAFVSLFLLRPISIWLSLLGQRLQWQTVVFFGWFGPRGLATVVFVLVAIEELGVLDPLVLDTLNVAVLASIVLHGLSAVPMSRWLGRVDMAEDMPEMGDAFPHPTRR